MRVPTVESTRSGPLDADSSAASALTGTAARIDAAAMAFTACSKAATIQLLRDAQDISTDVLVSDWCHHVMKSRAHKRLVAASVISHYFQSG